MNRDYILDKSSDILLNPAEALYWFQQSSSIERVHCMERNLVAQLAVVDRSSICRHFAEDAGFVVSPIINQS